MVGVSPPFAELSLSFPLPCGWGLRGWVDTTIESQAKLATANKHSASSLRASRKTCVAIQNQTRLAQKIDCHANSLRSFARNDGKVASNDKSLSSPSFSTSGQSVISPSLNTSRHKQISSPSLCGGG